MANLYVADDGTIHDRDVGHCQRVTSDGVTFQTTNYTTPEVGEGRKVAFWFITMAIAVLIGYVLYSAVGTMVFERVNNPDELLDHIVNFFCVIAPFVIIGGSVTCAILYGTKCAADRGYSLGTYFLSALSAAGGTVGVGGALFLLALIITIALYILLVVIIVAVIVAALGGN